LSLPPLLPSEKILNSTCGAIIASLTFSLRGVVFYNVDSLNRFNLRGLPEKKSKKLPFQRTRPEKTPLVLHRSIFQCLLFKFLAGYCSGASCYPEHPEK